MFVEIFPRPRACCLIFLFTFLAGAFPSPGVAANSFNYSPPTVNRRSDTNSAAVAATVDARKPNFNTTTAGGTTTNNNNDASTNTTGDTLNVTGDITTTTGDITTTTGDITTTTGDITTTTGDTLTDTDVTTTTTTTGRTSIVYDLIASDRNPVAAASETDLKASIEAKMEAISNNLEDISLDQAEAVLLSIVAALEDPTKSDLDPQSVNRALQAVGDNILNNSNAATATVAGNLHQASVTNIGSFAFQVNLGSGDISKARMSGSDPNNIWGGGNAGGSFDLSGGTGKLSGNDFSVGGLAGNMTNSLGTVTGQAVGSLSGTATDGFQGLSNNSIANGKYTVTQPDGTGIDSGTITGGRVN